MELDLPLVAVGVGTYLVWQLLPLCGATVASLLHRRRVSGVAAPANGCNAAKGHWSEGAPSDSEAEAAEQSSRLEPDEEPVSLGNCVAAPRRGSCHRWSLIFCSALVIFLVLLLHWGAGIVPDATFAEDGATAHKADFVKSEEAAPVATAVVPTSRHAGGHGALQEGKCFSGKPALTVQLTRLVGFEDGFEKSDYYGTINVGTPQLEMTVAFDTGSGHLILPSAYCKNKGCKKHVRYKSSASHSGRDIQFNGTTVKKGSSRDSISVEFGTGTATGVVIEDVICFGTETNASLADHVWEDSRKNGLEPGCVRMHFLAATHLSDDPFATFEFDGIMGLSLPGLSQTPRLNFMHMLYNMFPDNHRSCSSQAFGVFLACNNAEDSEIAFGGWDEGHLHEELSWSNVEDPSRGHWILPIKGLRVDHEPLGFCNDGCVAAVDTGTALLSVPTFAFKRIFSLLRHDADLAGHCQGYGPMLHFEFEDFSISLGPKEYSTPRERKTPVEQVDELYENGAMDSEGAPRRSDLRCFPTLMTLDEENLGGKLFLLGEPILRKYYTVYDGLQKRVGFGRANHVVAPTRDELLVKVPELDAAYAKSQTHKGSQPRRRAIPTMFDIFRWRSKLQQPPAMVLA